MVPNNLILKDNEDPNATLINNLIRKDSVKLFEIILNSGYEITSMDIEFMVMSNASIILHYYAYSQPKNFTKLISRGVISYIINNDYVELYKVLIENGYKLYVNDIPTMVAADAVNIIDYYTDLNPTLLNYTNLTNYLIDSSSVRSLSMLINKGALYDAQKLYNNPLTRPILEQV